MFLAYLILALIPTIYGAITVDFNCTVFDGTNMVYTDTATICSNPGGDAGCAVRYPNGPVVAGTDTARPFQCYSLTATGPIDASMKKAALEQCPKHCGLCCQTSAYSCSNAQFPNMNCATITRDQCLSPTWRPIIAKECPSACGFCNEGGCVDAVPECANDITICNNINLQPFVNTNCQRTCGRCSTNPSCISYNGDSATTCRQWAANGFCTNEFYTIAQRKAYCATTCKLC